MNRFNVRNPESGKVHTRIPSGKETSRPAAVLVILYRPDELHVLLTKRTERLSEHAGQISFPSGSPEPEDSSLLETALRETREELDIAAEAFEIAGELAPIYIPPSNFQVTPFVALADPLPRAPRPSS